MPEAGEQARGRAEMRPDGAPPTMVPMQQGTSAGAAAPESAGAQPSSTATAAGPGRRDDLSARTPRGHPPEPAPETPPAPRPLLPEVPQSAALPSTAVPVRSQGKADAEQPEVHVHIGRIDVTSVAEPQPQRRDPPRRREPAMSLEDYLSKRKSGG